MGARRAFPAGLALEAHKRHVAAVAIAAVPAPARLRFALDQGSGSELEPVVAVGERVAVGTLIARPVDAYGAPLHSSVSGQVVAVDVLDAAAGRPCTCVQVDNDGADARADRGPPDLASLDPGTLVARLREAGLAGLGGAGFPTATKLDVARARGARRLLLNGAECEPWVCCDDALLRTRPEDVLDGAAVLMRALEADTCAIAVEDDKPEAIAALRAALATRPEPRVTVVVVPAIYPRGAERQLIDAVWQLEVPARGLPADVGVTCQNVATAAAVAQWARTGEPLLSRVVTVTGSGVAHPRNVLARIGTPLAALVAAAGGYVDSPLRLIAGGNMTGRALANDEAGLDKATNCVFVATAADLGARLHARELPCIRCGDCATVCAPGLLPQQIHRAVMADDLDAADAFGVRECIDCGCCDYVCPSQIPLAQRFRAGRARLRARDEDARRAEAARLHHEQRLARLQETAAEERRALDAARAQARGAGGSAPASGDGA